MLILTAYKAALLTQPAIVTAARGGMHIGTVEQGALRPNILLTLTGGGRDYSHQGPSAIIDAGIKVECRADKDEAAGQLSELVVDFLSCWQGTLHGCWVQLSQHMSTTSSYDAPSKQHVCTSEFTAFYRKVG